MPKSGAEREILLCEVCERYFFSQKENTNEAMTRTMPPQMAVRACILLFFASSRQP